MASLVEPLCGRDLDFAELAWVVIICSWCRNPLRPLSGTLSALLLLLRARTIGPLTLCGIADLDTERDARIIALAPFSVLTDALANIPLVCTRIGTTQEVLTRIGLQLVYEYFKAAGGGTRRRID